MLDLVVNLHIGSEMFAAMLPWAMVQYKQMEAAGIIL